MQARRKPAPPRRLALALRLPRLPIRARMLALAGTPQVYVASVHNLSPYDHVYAQLWVRGAGGSTKARIWASVRGPNRISIGKSYTLSADDPGPRCAGLTV